MLAEQPCHRHLLKLFISYILYNSALFWDIVKYGNGLASSFGVLFAGRIRQGDQKIFIGCLVVVQLQRHRPVCNRPDVVFFHASAVTLFNKKKE
jgi:hypothetical protein